MKTHATRAFTLIEVIVALALFTGVVAMLSQAISVAVDVIDSLDSDTRREQEFRFAVRQIIQVKDRDELEDGGELATLESGPITWEAEVIDTNTLDLFEVRLSLLWVDSGDGYSVEQYQREQTLFLLRPAWSDPDERSSLLETKTRDLEQSRRF